MAIKDLGFLKNFSKTRYLELFPKLKEEKIQKITEIVLTLITVPLFGIFAISPTLSTIIELRRKLSDNQHVYMSMREKNKNLSILQGKYSTIQPDLPIIVSAIPTTQNSTRFIAQLQALSLQNTISLASIQISQLNLSPSQKEDQNNFSFTLSAKGSFDNLLLFAKSLIHFERITTIDTISIGASPEKNNTSSMNLNGKAYFKK